MAQNLSARQSSTQLVGFYLYVLSFGDFAGILAEMASRCLQSGATVKLGQKEFRARRSFSPGLPQPIVMCW